MSEIFSVEIISPEKSIIQTNTFEVVIPSYEGEMGILKGHIPLITFLRPGLVSISGDNEKKFFVEDGTVEFAENNLLILTSTAKEISTINKILIDTLISDAEKRVSDKDISDKEKYLLYYKIETLKNIIR